MDVLFTIFALVFLTELIQWVGQSVLLDLCYSIHLRVFARSTIQRRDALRAEVLAAKQDLLQTSSQDQFAKWAKLRRRVDKGLADLDKTNNELTSTRTSYSFKFKTGLWLLTTGVQFAVGWWYGRTAVFYLPPGWFGPATWWLSLPFAPRGSVSCGVWQMACKRVIKMCERIVRDLILAHASTPSEEAIPAAPIPLKEMKADSVKSSPPTTKPSSPSPPASFTPPAGSSTGAATGGRAKGGAGLRARMASSNS